MGILSIAIMLPFFSSSNSSFISTILHSLHYLPCLHSNSQREFIMGQAKARGLKNVQVLTGILPLLYFTLLYSVMNKSTLTYSVISSPQGYPLS